MNRLYWVRHGENPANLTKEFSSRRVDYSLTAKGHLQAEQTAQYFLDRDIHAVYSSPLKRGRETAEIIAAVLGLSNTVLDGLREIDVGDLELQPPSAEIWHHHDQVLADWLNGHPDTCFPNGDDYPRLKNRVYAAIQTMFSGKQGQNVIAVSHGGNLLVTLLELCPEVTLEQVQGRQVDNCSIMEVSISFINGTPRGKIIHWPTSAHLSGEAAQLVRGTPAKGEL